MPSKVRKPLTPEQRARKNAARRLWERANPDKLWRPKTEAEIARRRLADRDRKRRARAAAGPKKLAGPGAALAATAYAMAAPSPGRDMLAAIAALVPRRADRDEIVAEAVLLVIEGAPIPEAVKAATKAVRRADREFAYALPLEECRWIGA